MGASLIEAKMRMREQALAARSARRHDAAAPARRLAGLLRPHAGKLLAGYWPMRGEADPRPALTAHAGPVCLPVVVGRGQPLLFRAWRADMPLQKGVFGTRHPPPEAPEVIPEVVIVPLAAFDDRLTRLGYGGGYYDRTLAALRARGKVLAIGLAFADQQRDSVPADALDAPLDLIVTEEAVLSRPAGPVRPETAPVDNPVDR